MYKIGRYLLILLFTACSSESELPDEFAQLDNLTEISNSENHTQSIQFYREAVYRETEKVILGRISGMVVDNRRRVFIADGDQNVVHVFNEDGGYIKQLGNEGKGPGEFSNISYLKIDEQYLYAYDWSLRGVNVFSLDNLEFSHVVPFQREDREIEELSGTYPGEFYLRNDGTYLVSFNRSYSPDDLEEERSSIYYLLDDDGKIISDKIFEHKVGEVLTDRSGNGFMVMYSPFGRRPLFEVADDDRLFTAWTEDFLIKVYSPEGSYEQAYYYPYQKVSLNINEITSQYEGSRQRRMIRNADVPETWPALNSLLVDDKHRIWVSTITDDEEVYDWWVIGSEGNILARFTWSRERRVLDISNQHVFVQEEDVETGLQQIVKYRIALS